MRFYDIQVFDALLGPRMRSDGTPYRWTSFANGQTDLGALQVEFDIPVTTFAGVATDSSGGMQSGATIRIWGIPLQDIGQASDLNDASIAVYGGMQKGLPLANPAQKGLLVAGRIQQAFGNWVGNEMTLDLVIVNDGTPATDAPGTPKNLPMIWKKATPLADAIRTTLSTGFPDYKAQIDVSSKLVLAADEVGHYTSIVQFAQYLQQMSRAIVTDKDYAGVNVTLSDKTFIVYDGTSQKAPLQIDFNDLIGQPTWIGTNTVQFICVMRADILVSSYVKMPQNAVQTTAAQSFSRYRDKSVFQGAFVVNSVHHIGNFRSPEAQSWISIYEASSSVPATTGGGAAASVISTVTSAI